MSKYCDVYLLPIAEEKLAEYKKLARSAGKIFVKHGALRYREYAVSDLNEEYGTFPFGKALKLKPGETIVYAAVEFKSEAHRNKTMKAIFADPELAKVSPKDPPFDYKRMVYSGFKVIVDL